MTSIFDIVREDAGLLIYDSTLLIEKTSSLIVAIFINNLS